jgi:hypothetical protein
MTYSTVTYRAVDGGEVKIGSSRSLTLPVTAYGYAQGHQFEAGNLNLGRIVAADLGVNLSESYTLQGGTLSRGTAVHIDPQDGYDYLFGLALWEGNSHSVDIKVDPSAPSSAVIALFDSFTLTDVPAGLILTPRTGSYGQNWNDAPRILKFVPGLGLLIVRQLTRELVTSTELLPPAGEGEPVDGGWLYQVPPLEAGDYPNFILISSDSVTTIDPDDDASLDEVLVGLAELRVGWTDWRITAP